MQSTPVCRLQGRALEAEGWMGGGLPTDEDTEEDDGSNEDGGSEREARLQPVVDDEQGGETDGLGASSGCIGLGGVDKVSAAPCGMGRADGLDDGRVGLVWVGQSSATNGGSGVLQLLSTV